MSIHARRELLASVSARYAGASRAEKTRILDEFAAATGYHRKYATALLSTAPSPKAPEPPAPPRRTRARRYTPEVQAVLVSVWEAAGRICSKRLVPFLPEIVGRLEHLGYLALTDGTRERLLSMSAATADRLLAPRRRAERGRGRTTTLPGSLLKHHVPLRTFSDWDELRPGFVEADLVAHCGTSTAGSYVHTLTLTDVSTGWTECLALPYRDQETVLQALKVGRARLPFELLGLDTDNGSEFLNYGLLDYCSREQITSARRSRAYRKNDQCHVEEKNGSVVRRFVGYDRFEGLAPCRVLSGLYAVLRLYVNFFQPSMKLVSKHREGGKVAGKYDVAQTPYQRVLASDQVSEEVKRCLRRRYHELDPVALLSQVDALQDRLWPYAYVPARALEEHEQFGGDGGVLSLATTTAPTLAEPVVEAPSLVGGDGASHTAIPAPPGGVLAIERRARTYRKTKRKGRYHLVKHTWRTRPDPFAEVKEEVEAALAARPSLEAKALFLSLQAKHPGAFSDGQLRTLQRRVKAWRLRYAMAVAEEVGLIIDAGESGSSGPPG